MAFLKSAKTTAAADPESCVFLHVYVRCVSNSSVECPAWAVSPLIESTGRQTLKDMD